MQCAEKKQTPARTGTKCYLFTPDNGRRNGEVVSSFHAFHGYRWLPIKGMEQHLGSTLEKQSKPHQQQGYSRAAVSASNGTLVPQRINTETLQYCSWVKHTQTDMRTWHNWKNPVGKSHVRGNALKAYLVPSRDLWLVFQLSGSEHSCTARRGSPLGSLAKYLFFFANTNKPTVSWDEKN